MSNELLENIETLEGQPSGNSGGFERLVGRLARVFDDAADEYAERQESPHFRETQAGIRAVLAELAKAHVDEAIPHADEIAEAWNREPSPIAPKLAVCNLMCERVTPLLAAKNAELARQTEEIERLRAEAMPTYEQLAEEAARFAYDEYEPGWWDRATEGQRARVTKEALYIVLGGDDRSVFGTQVRLYAKGSRRVGRRATDSIAIEAPSMNITSADD